MPQFAPTRSGDQDSRFRAIEDYLSRLGSSPVNAAVEAQAAGLNGNLPPVPSGGVEFFVDLGDVDDSGADVGEIPVFDGTNYVVQNFTPSPFGFGAAPAADQPIYVQATIAAGNLSKFYFTPTSAADSGMRGLHLQKKSTEAQAIGLCLEYDTGPLWDTVAIDSSTTDLVLAFSHALSADVLRLRADTAQMAFGRTVGQPAIGGAQFQMVAGSAGVPKDGLSIAQFGNKNSILLLQSSAGTKRTMLNFNNNFLMGSDSAQTNVADYWFYDAANDNFALIISATDKVGLGMGISTPTAPTAQLHVTRSAVAANPANPTMLKVVGRADTAMAASTEVTDVLFDFARTLQFATGALTTERAFRIAAPTYAFVAASTITNAATFYIDNAPVAGTNATITNPYALWIDAGLSRFDGNGTHVFELPADATDPTGGGGAAAGRIPILVGGALKYLPYY